jgi:acyl carrier protein
MDIQIKTPEIITKKQIKDMLLDFISDKYLVDKEDIQLDKSLIDLGIIDSMGLIEISDFIKRNFNFIVAVDQMTRKNFGSVLLIVDYINNNKK